MLIISNERSKLDLFIFPIYLVKLCRKFAFCGLLEVEVHDDDDIDNDGDDIDRISIYINHL